jgi:hypothetical protein
MIGVRLRACIYKSECACVFVSVCVYTVFLYPNEMLIVLPEEMSKLSS